MRRAYAAAALLAALRASSFTLEPLRVFKRPWSLRPMNRGDAVWAGAPDSRFNATGRVAWVPVAENATAEARRFHDSFYAGNGTLERVPPAPFGAGRARLLTGSLPAPS